MSLTSRDGRASIGQSAFKDVSLVTTENDGRHLPTVKSTGPMLNHEYSVNDRGRNIHKVLTRECHQRRRTL